LLCTALALGLAACGDDDGGEVRSEGESSASASGSGASGSGSGSAPASGSEPAPVCEPFGDKADADTTVNVTLTEFAYELDKDSVPAGTIHFALDNKGAEPHEFAVVKGTDIPTKDDGSLDEENLADGALIGEVEPFPTGTCDGTFELAAGEYTLLCDVVEEEEDGTIESHLNEGMKIAFTVT
jgi:hypothetical protein